MSSSHPPLVALCSGLAGAIGPLWVLRLGACTAALAAGASFVRLATRRREFGAR
jgi:hypothetical protein